MSNSNKMLAFKIEKHFLNVLFPFCYVNNKDIYKGGKFDSSLSYLFEEKNIDVFDIDNYNYRENDLTDYNYILKMDANNLKNDLTVDKKRFNEFLRHEFPEITHKEFDTNNCENKPICKPRNSKLNVTSAAAKNINNLNVKGKDIMDLCTLIDTERMKIDNEFLDLGSAIFNCTAGKRMDLWEYIAEERVDECDKYWKLWLSRGYPSNDKNIKYIEHLCKIDNLEGYKNWCNNNINKLIDISVSPLGSSRDIANILRVMLGDNVVFTNDGSEKCYFFNGGVWEYSPNAGYLIDILVKKVKPLFEEKSKKLSKAVDGVRDATEEIRKPIEEQLKKCNRIQKDLGEPGPKRAIVSESFHFFKDKTFADDLDTNDFVLPFKEGNLVYDAKTCKIRRGLPSDKMSMRSNFNFNPSFNWKHEDIVFWTDFFKKMFPYNDVRDFVLKYYGSTCQKGAKEKFMLVMVSPPHCAKSTLMNAIEEVMGEFYCKPPTETIISSKFSSDGSGATPHLEVMRNKNGMVFQEPKNHGNIYLDDSMIKLIASGGLDKVYSRDLRQSAKTIKSFKIKGRATLVTNKVPKIHGSDEAMADRLLILWLFSRFLLNAPKTQEEQWKKHIFPRDDEFPKKCMQKLDALGWILMEYHKKYAKEGLKVPKYIMNASKKYALENDPIYNFIQEKIIINTCEKKEDENEEEYNKRKKKVQNANKVRVAGVYRSYQMWMQLNNPNNKCMPKDDFIKELERKGMKRQGAYYYGVGLNS
jgi:phage/plasmid-associated DNA primase